MLVDALPNGPRAHPTVQVFLAGGVPEVMLHLRKAGLLRLDALTVSGDDYVEKVASETGGEVVHADPPGPAFREMVARLRKRYTFYYPMPQAKKGQIRKVTVELAPPAKKRYPDAEVLARKGYLAGK